MGTVGGMLRGCLRGAASSLPAPCCPPTPKAPPHPSPLLIHHLPPRGAEAACNSLSPTGPHSIPKTPERSTPSSSPFVPPCFSAHCGADGANEHCQLQADKGAALPSNRLGSRGTPMLGMAPPGSGDPPHTPLKMTEGCGSPSPARSCCQWPPRWLRRHWNKAEKVHVSSKPLRSVQWGVSPDPPFNAAASREPPCMGSNARSSSLNGIEHGKCHSHRGQRTALPTSRGHCSVLPHFRGAINTGMGAQGLPLPVVQLHGDHVPPEQGGEEGDREVVQLIDSHLHGGVVHAGAHGCADRHGQLRLRRALRGPAHRPGLYGQRAGTRGGPPPAPQRRSR